MTREPRRRFIAHSVYSYLDMSLRPEKCRSREAVEQDVLLRSTLYPWAHTCRCHAATWMYHTHWKDSPRDELELA
jgi:hypothetical protein